MEGIEMVTQRHPNCENTECKVCLEDAELLAKALEERVGNLCDDHLGEYYNFLKENGIKADTEHGWFSTEAFNDTNMDAFAVGASPKPNNERAVLGVDGNAGFALLGENIQEGEAEFVCIDEAPEIHKAKHDKERWAATQSLRKLEERLGRRLSYYIGPSHPDHQSV